jgi:hypothetical protein
MLGAYVSERKMNVEDHTIIVRFGAEEVEDSRIEARVTETIARPSTAELIIPNDLLQDMVINYQTHVQVIAVTDADSSVVFEGLVDRLTPERDKTHIILARFLDSS